MVSRIYSGISYAGSVDTQVHNSYLNVEKDPRDGTYHPLVRGLENATRIINGVNWVHVTPTQAQAYSPLTLVPSYPDLPMEEVFARVPRTDTPGVFVRETGKGRVVLLFPSISTGRSAGDPRSGSWGGAQKRRDVGAQNRTATDGHGAGNDRRISLGTKELDYRASGQPDKSHDDEGAGPRIGAIAAAKGAGSDSERAKRQISAVSGESGGSANYGSQRSAGN